MKTVHELEILKQDFLEYLVKECGRSSKTIENYDRYLKRFLAHTKAKTPKAITEHVVREYTTWLNTQVCKPRKEHGTCEPLKKNTQNYYLIALRGFLKYLHELGVTTLDAKRIKLTQANQFVSESVSDTELVRLLSAPDGKDLKSMRDRAILQLLFSTGVRVSELCALNMDVDLLGNKLAVLGKGGVFRDVTLTSEAKDAVQTYLKARVDLGEALFVNNGKRVSEMGETRLSPRSVQRIVRFYAIKAGIQKNITPHVLRHTLAKSLLGSGVEVQSVQEMLGHEHASSTKFVYVRSTK